MYSVRPKPSTVRKRAEKRLKRREKKNKKRRPAWLSRQLRGEW